MSAPPLPRSEAARDALARFGLAMLRWERAADRLDAGVMYDLDEDRLAVLIAEEEEAGKEQQAARAAAKAALEAAE